MSLKVCIVGSGPGGYMAALRLAELGAGVTVIEKGEPGGVCVNWGCIPTKALMTSTGMLRQFQTAGEFGLDIQGRVAADLRMLAARKDRVVATQKKAIEGSFAGKAIRFLRGQARIEGPGRLLLTEPDGKESPVEWDRLILAPGSKPAKLPGYSFDGKWLLSSDQILNLEVIPARLLIVGGGVIGCEFASIFSDLGSTVEIIEALPRILPLPGVDEETSRILNREMKKQKIKVRTNCGLQKLETGAEGIRAFIEGSSWDSPGEFDQVLIAVGRRPDTVGLGLDETGIKTDDKGWIVVDDTMATNVENVYAIGDVLGPSRIMLAHAATHEGITAAENIMGGDRAMSYRALPAAIFTHPEVACVGLTEKEAVQEGYDADTETVLFRELGKAQALGELPGQAKAVWDRKTGRLLGMNIIGCGATELIAESSLALTTGRTIKELAATIHAHPTLSEIIWEVARRAERHGD